LQSSHFYTPLGIWVSVRPILKESPCTNIKRKKGKRKTTNSLRSPLVQQRVRILCALMVRNGVNLSGRGSIFLLTPCNPLLWSTKIRQKNKKKKTNFHENDFFSTIQWRVMISIHMYVYWSKMGWIFQGGGPFFCLHPVLLCFEVQIQKGKREKDKEKQQISWEWMFLH